MSDDSGTPRPSSGSRSISRYINPTALSAIVMWGAIAPFTKFALAEVPALPFIAFRMGAAALIVFSYMRIRRVPIAIEREDVPKFLLAGLGFFALSTLFFTMGLSRTTVAHMVILASIGPLLGAVYRWLAQGDRPDRRSMVAMCIGFAGVLIVVGDASSAEGASIVGDLMGLASSALWVGMTVYPQPLVKKYGALRSTGWFIAIALLLIVPLSLPSLGSVVSDPPHPLVWGAVGYAALATLVGNTLWQAAVQQVGPARTLIYMYLQPFCSLLIAAIVLGDRVTPEQAIGGLLAIGGVMLVKKR